MVISFTKTPQIENILIQIASYAPPIGGHGSQFKMAANQGSHFQLHTIMNIYQLRVPSVSTISGLLLSNLTIALRPPDNFTRIVETNAGCYAFLMHVVGS